MPQILFAVPSEATRAVIDELTGLLATDTHELLVAGDAREARQFCRCTGIDLVVGDLGMSDIDWGELRPELSELLSPSPTPFVFVVPSEKGDELRTLMTSGPVTIAGHPPDARDLAALIGNLLDTSRLKEGDFSGDRFDRLLSQVAGGELSGVLTAYHGPILKKVVFVDGAITAASSNFPPDSLRQWLLREELLTLDELRACAPGSERELRESEAVQSIDADRLAVLERRRRFETVLGLYLWTTGAWSFLSSRLPGDENAVPLVELVEEGRRRAKRWRDLGDRFGNTELRFRIVGDLGDFDDDDVCEPLMELIAAGKTLGEIRLELAGQDFLVMDACARLVDASVLQILDETDTTAGDTAETRVSPESGEQAAIGEILGIAERHLDDGDLQAALEAYEDVLRLDPRNTQARLAIADLDAATTASAANVGLLPDTRVGLNVAVEDLGKSPMAPEHAFILSRLVSGAMRVGALVSICPLSESEVLGILQIHLDRGTLKVEGPGAQGDD